MLRCNVVLATVPPCTARCKQWRCCSGSQLLQTGHVGVQVFGACCTIRLIHKRYDVTASCRPQTTRRARQPKWLQRMPTTA